MTARYIAPLLLACFVSFVDGYPRGFAAEFQVSADPDKSCSAIALTGEIRRGDDQKFKAALSEAVAVAPMRRLYLNSRGGDFLTSTFLWEEIRRREPPIETIVSAGHQCSSACILLLAAGERRNVSSTARIKLHQARNSLSNEPTVLGTLTYGYYLVESGLSREVVDILKNLKPADELEITASNARRSGFVDFHFFGSTNPPATKGCAWPGFLRASP